MSVCLLATIICQISSAFLRGAREENSSDDDSEEEIDVDERVSVVECVNTGRRAEQTLA